MCTAYPIGPIPRPGDPLARVVSLMRAAFTSAPLPISRTGRLSALLLWSALCAGTSNYFSDNPAPVCGAIFGPLFALSSIAESVGVAPVLRRTELGKIALFLALARVAGYGSRLAALRWAKSQAVEETVGLSAALTKDKLYAALDYAAEEQPRIERELYHRYLASQATPPVLVLYDVTSVWLEGQNNELAEYGHDRDHRRSKNYRGRIAHRPGWGAAGDPGVSRQSQRPDHRRGADRAVARAIRDPKRRVCWRPRHGQRPGARGRGCGQVSVHCRTF